MPLDNNTPKVRNNPMPTPKDDAVAAAHDEAEKDMEQDDDLGTVPEPIDDLDEGESAAYEDDKADADENRSI